MATRSELNELLKEARLYHYALLALCATLLALMPKFTDLSDIYKLAEEDVRYVQGILDRPWEESHTEQRDKFERLDHKGIVRDRAMFRDEISTGLSRSLDKEITSRWPEKSRNLHLFTHLPFAIEAPPYTATMRDLREFYTAPPLKVLVPDVDFLTVKLRTSLPPECLLKSCQVDLQFSGSVDRTSTAGSQVTSSCLMKTHAEGAIDSSQTFSSSASIFDLRGPDFSQEMNASFPYLRQISDQISLLTPEQSILYLESKQISSQETISVLGISIPQSMRVIVVSIVCVILAVFLSHILRLDTMTNGGTSEDVDHGA